MERGNLLTMPFIKLIEALILLVLFVVGLTQVILPILNSRPIFPIFRKRAKLESRVVDLNERKDEAKLERQLRRSKDGSRRV